MSVSADSRSQLEENKSEDNLSDMDGEGEEDDLASKFGFRQIVSLDMELPNGEHEIINHFPMQFIDRNPFRGG